MPRRLPAALLALALLVAPAAQASQATLVTPAAPLPMTSLATFLNAALLSLGSCNSGTSAPTNGAGSAAFAGECWIDTTTTMWVVKRYDGADWIVVGYIDTTLNVASPLTLLRYCLIGVNFNSANTDNPITIAFPTSRYVVNSIRIGKASASISTATIGVFTSTGGGGQAIAANQAITVTATAADSNNNEMSLSVPNTATEAYTDTTLQVRVGTAQGSPATADVCVIVSPQT